MEKPLQKPLLCTTRLLVGGNQVKRCTDFSLLGKEGRKEIPQGKKSCLASSGKFGVGGGFVALGGRDRESDRGWILYWSQMIVESGVGVR